MSITEISSNSLGKEVQCKLCHAGSLISFNWKYAIKESVGDDAKNESDYINPRPLKSGTLFECKACGSKWYLDGKEESMNHVIESKLALIEEWSSECLNLVPEQQSILSEIGRTPPDLYGNGAQYEETPCTVETTDGEYIEFAIISKQSHAPFEHWRNYRLASEIKTIGHSQYALPLKVREATSQADEIRMSFAPTLVCLSNGQKAVLNGIQHFLKMKDVKIKETTVCNEQIDISAMPAIYSQNEEVTYFVVDK